MFKLYFHITVHHERSQDRTLEAEPEAEATEDLCWLTAFRGLLNLYRGGTAHRGLDLCTAFINQDNVPIVMPTG